MVLREFTGKVGTIGATIHRSIGAVLVADKDTDCHHLLSMLEAVRRGYAKRMPKESALPERMTEYEIDESHTIAVFRFEYESEKEGAIFCLHPQETTLDLQHFKTLANELDLDPNLFFFKQSQTLSANEVNALLRVFGISYPTQEDNTASKESPEQV